MPIAQNQTILLTGGTGYIGSHAVVAFEQAGFNTVIIDNFSNSTEGALNGIEAILGYKPIFYEGDIRDENFLTSIFQKFSFNGVIHFAGKKYVTESIEYPFEYFENNISGSLILFKIMEKFGVKNIVFSSTAGVYDSNNQIPPFSEDTLKKVIHPYAASKLMIENILEQLSLTKKVRSLSLRYFNVMGAHESGLIGDNYFGNETNVIGYLYRTALGKQLTFPIYGNNFDTRDGTATRDYIDVWDLVQAHVKGYCYIMSKTEFLSEAINIGNGIGVTVKELSDMVEKITGKTIFISYKEPRFGDVSISISSAEKAFTLFDWSPKITLEESIQRSWRFAQSSNFDSNLNL